VARQPLDKAPKPPLLEREDLATTNPVDAQHWISIYGQLINFKHLLIRRGTRALELLDDDALATAKDDLLMLSNQLEHFEHRRQAWLDRERQLRGLTVDERSNTISFQGHTIPLTRREIELLDALLRRGGRPASARILVEEAWRDSALTSEQLRLYITRLRAKLAPVGALEIRHEAHRGYSTVFT
jgi:DNA-binding response OmpR family regulator